MIKIKRLNLKHFLGLIGLIACAAGVSVSFQNCSSPPDASHDASSVASTAGFAYDSQIDYLAYMSCSNMPSGYDPKAFFTFKAAAYETGGIKLTSEYLYAARNLDLAGKIQALNESLINKDAILEMSVRQTTNMQTIWPSGNPYMGDFIGSLSQSSVANKLFLLPSGTRANTFPEVGADKFEDLIYLNSNEANANQIRSDLTQNLSMLSFTYNKVGGDPITALAPTTGSTTSVYGTGYRMLFQTGFGHSNADPTVKTPYSVGALRVMTNVREYSLIDNKPTSSTWDCNPNWAFLIVKPTDVGSATLCTPLVTEPTTADYIAIRKILPATDWAVNLSQHCVVPKKAGSCYGSATTINYSGGICDPVAGTCPHYLTICKKR